MKYVQVFSALLVLSLTATSLQATARGRDDRLELRLSPSKTFATAHGKAHFKDRGGEREFELEVEDLRSLSGQKLRALVDGVLVGQPSVNTLGYADLNLNSDRRENVPAIKSGSRVEVRTNANVLVVSGQF
jgi:hypothetical protein